MMRFLASISASLIVLALAQPAARAWRGGIGTVFPDIKGWTREGEPVRYSPDDLFEYIDGAADAFLGYDFEELAVLSYNGGGKRSISIEVYRHRDLRDAFGIYSQERPRNAGLIAMGAEGYRDKGLINFYQGPYYVKVMGFHLEESDEEILSDAARGVAANLGESGSLPEVLACLPSKGKVSGSERYVARDVLGHGFLHSAYTADYDVLGSVKRVYVFEGRDDEDAAKMLDDYMRLAESTGATSAQNGRRGTCRFKDPQRTSGEPMNLRLSGRYIFGLFADDEKAAAALLDAIETNLKARRLIE